MPDHADDWRALRRGPRMRTPEQRLEVPEHALIAALLRQALADRTDTKAAVRHESRAWFQHGWHRYWLQLAGLPESSLDHVLQGEI